MGNKRRRFVKVDQVRGLVKLRDVESLSSTGDTELDMT